MASRIPRFPQSSRLQLRRAYTHSTNRTLTRLNTNQPPDPKFPNGSFSHCWFIMVGSLALLSTVDKDDDKKKNTKKKFPGTIEEFPKVYKLPTQKLKKPTDSKKKAPVVLVACGSFSPITVMHLRLLEMAKDYFDSNGYEVIGGYLSPVADSYGKKGLVNAIDRTNMAILATEDSDWIMVDTWEASNSSWTPTVKVLDHFHEEVNRVYPEDVNVIFVCGSDLLNSFNVPNLWNDADIQKICSYGLAVITREGADPSLSIWKNDLLYINRTKIHLIHQWIPNDISSTLVRIGISRGLSIKYLLPNNVLEYISERGLYSEEKD